MELENEKQEYTNFWREPELGNTELLHARFVNHSYTRHSHDTFAIGMIEVGAEEFECNRQKFVAPAGSIVVINPGEVHTGQAASEGGWTYRMLYPEAELLQKVLSETTGKQGVIPFFKNVVIGDNELAPELLNLHFDLQSPISNLERQSRFLWWLTRLIQRHSETRQLPLKEGHEPRAIRQAREFLVENYRENISLDTLAEKVGLSPYHLLRTFRRSCGLPPHAYQNQVRLNQARTLLKAGWHIPQVAIELGYVDQSHFTRQFKRIMGVTPGQYIKRNNLQDNPSFLT